MSRKGPFLTWSFACMFGRIVEDVKRIAPSSEPLGAPSGAVAEASVFSPSGAELGVMHHLKMRV